MSQGNSTEQSSSLSSSQQHSSFSSSSQPPYTPKLEEKKYPGIASQNHLTREKASDELFAAVGVGDAEKVAALIKQDASLINAKNAQGHSPLFVAVKKGHLAVVTILLATKEGRALVGQTDRRGCTPLMVAAAQDNLDLITALLATDEGRGTINKASFDGMETPLVRAVRRGSLTSVAALLATHEGWRAVNGVNSVGATSLVYAAVARSFPLLKFPFTLEIGLLLLLHNADFEEAEMWFTQKIGDKETSKEDRQAFIQGLTNLRDLNRDYKQIEQFEVLPLYRPETEEQIKQMTRDNLERINKLYLADIAKVEEFTDGPFIEALNEETERRADKLPEAKRATEGFWRDAGKDDIEIPMLLEQCPWLQTAIVSYIQTHSSPPSLVPSPFEVLNRIAAQKKRIIHFSAKPSSVIDHAARTITVSYIFNNYRLTKENETFDETLGVKGVVDLAAPFTIVATINAAENTLTLRVSSISISREDAALLRLQWYFPNWFSAAQRAVSEWERLQEIFNVNNVRLKELMLPSQRMLSLGRQDGALVNSYIGDTAHSKRLAELTQFMPKSNLPKDQQEKLLLAARQVYHENQRLCLAITQARKQGVTLQSTPEDVPSSIPQRSGDTEVMADSKHLPAEQTETWYLRELEVMRSSSFSVDDESFVYPRSGAGWSISAMQEELRKVFAQKNRGTAAAATPQPTGSPGLFGRKPAPTLSDSNTSPANKR